MDLSTNDHRLIAALRNNARKSVSELARELGMSRTTVQKRIGQMEAAGIIAGYSLKLGDSYAAQTFQAYVSLVVKPRYSSAVAAALQRLPAVEALYAVSGKIDLVAIMRVNSPAQMDETLDRIGSIEGVEDTESAIVLTTRFDRR
jgi:DNA-binding Lrp family transcriptional regulator